MSSLVDDVYRLIIMLAFVSVINVSQNAMPIAPLPMTKQICFPLRGAYLPLQSDKLLAISTAEIILPESLCLATASGRLSGFFPNKPLAQNVITY